MRLTRLRLNGFKSFADPAEFLIAPGLTGVVGPNGCGKSNLLEALRWVMGETRPSQMRGGGMEDVIFAGTARRGARAQAEVVLTFEREGGETELVRRIARDGGSAYRLGGREARARDIQVMFADAASGAQSPALVRQGQIAELIGQKPVARRRVIEEAAGVAGLQARRAEAIQKLVAAEANLARVAEVAAGLGERLRGLERQARNAERYREIAAAIRLGEGQLLWHGIQAAAEALAAAEGEARTRAGLAQRAEAEAARAADARAEADAALPPLRMAALEAAEAAMRLRAEGEAEEAAGRRATGRLAELERQAADLARDAGREEDLAREAADTLARLSAEAARLAQAAEGEEERLFRAQAATEAAARALGEAEAALSGATEAAARLGAEAEAAQRRLQERSRDHDRAAQEARRAASALSEAEAAVLRLDAQDRTAREAVERTEAALQAAEAAMAQAEAALTPAQDRQAAARVEAAEAEAQAAGLGAEARALARLVTADGSREGEVGGMLSLPPGLEAAVAAALGRDLRAPVAADGSGWTLLPPLAETGLPPLAETGLPEGATRLSDLVGAPPELARRLMATGLVSAAEAERLWPLLRPGQRLVTRDGDLWRWDGFRRLAPDAGEAAAEAEAMRRAARLPGLRAEAEAAGERAREARAAGDAAVRALAQVTAALEGARSARKAGERQAEEARRAAGRAEADRALAGAKGEAAREGRAWADAGAEAARAALSGAQAARAACPDPAEARAAAAQAQLQAQAARNALLEARGAEDEGRRRAEGRARRAAEVQREEGLWREREVAAARRASDLAQRRERLGGEIARAAAEPGLIAERIAALREALGAAEARREEAQTALATAEAALRRTQEAERMAERLASRSREARAGAEAARAAAALREAEATARLRKERGQAPHELLAGLGGDARALPPDAAVQTEISALRRRRDALGPVNLRAEEDARALREEQGGLLRESADLSEAVEALRKGLSALNREGRERMVEAFGRVNAEFGRLFRHLFGGGEARLQFVDAEDPLEAGVEIMAQPPGKALGTLSLLSGGEQTLTALALIFAVFLVAPAPVCVLDEVDAPLDDANVGRFCDLLDAMARDTETRFLVITHHAVTMARMDRLYGVTMAERGVSQLVSVDLRAAEAMVA